MFIQTEDTPNPNTLKFMPGIVVLEKNRPQDSEIRSIRIMTKPDRYELILNKNGQCFIRHDETNLQWFLFKAKCVSQ